MYAFNETTQLMMRNEIRDQKAWNQMRETISSTALQQLSIQGVAPPDRILQLIDMEEVMEKVFNTATLYNTQQNIDEMKNMAVNSLVQKWSKQR